MNEIIANAIKYYLLAQGYEFIDKIGGLIRPISFDARNSENANDTITLPVSCDYSPETCNQEQLTEFVPDESYLSVIYFEGNAINYRDLNSKYYEGNTNLRLVCWLNMPKLGTIECNSSIDIIQQIISEIPKTLTIANMINVRISTGAIEKNNSIFSAYTYDEKATQYLMPPFDYFAININVQFWLARACAPLFMKGEPVCE
jgi:hypothetical protein